MKRIDIHHSLRSVVTRKFREEFEIRRVIGSAKNALKSTIDILIMTEMHNHIPELIQAYNQYRFSRDDFKKVTGFYDWIKQNSLSPLDILAFKAYVVIAEDYIDVEQLSVLEFLGRGEALVNKLEKYIGTAGNEIDQCLLDYFTAYCEAVERWGKLHLLHNPKLAFKDYSWSCFMEWVNGIHGGKDNYLEPSAIEKIRIANTRRNVNLISQYRAFVLNQNNLALYDELGKIGVDIKKADELMESHGYL